MPSRPGAPRAVADALPRRNEMIGRARTALKFFVYGLVLGLLFAPRSGEETRGRIFAWLNQTVKDTVGGLTGEAGNA